MNLSSYKIFSIFGINVELHWSFILFLLAFLIISPSFFIVLAIIFLFVTLHEVCHSIVSLRHDVEVKKILLLPIGGMAMMDTTDLDPWTEIKMSVAGPAFNFAAAGTFFLLGTSLGFPLMEWASNFLADPEFSLPLFKTIVFYAFYANLALGTFNLVLPAFPLDGGRVFRALLAFKYPYLKATEIAKYVSYFVSASLFFVGLIGMFTGFGGLWIMIIAVFIGLGASGEYKGLVVHTSLSKVDLEDLITRDYPLLDPEETLDVAVNKIMNSHRSNGIIKSEKLGIIDTERLKKTERKNWGKIPVKDLKKDVKTFKMKDSPEDIFKYINNSNNNPIPVVKGQELEGAIYYSDIQEMMKIIKEVGGLYEKRGKGNLRED